MSDEIDIEEHDVMENPSIKRIFPDLSVIKREINQYYYEDTVVQDVKIEQPVKCVSNLETITCEENEKYNDVLIDTKENILTKIEPFKESNQLHGNIIILGSKPNKDSERNSTNAPKPQIVLKKIDSFLKESKRFCDQCLILFSKQIFYNLHKINVHAEKPKGYKLHRIQKCLQCNEFLSSRSRKYAHQNIKDSKTSKQKIITDADSKTESSKGNHCFHCQKLFPTQSSLIEHLYEVLTPNNTENCKGTTKYKKEHASLDLRDVNLPDSIGKKSVTLNIKCDKCKETFLSKRKLRYHNMTVHRHCKKLIPKNKSKQGKSSNGLNKCGLLLYRCPFCSKYNVDMKYYSLHILSDHKTQIVAKAKKVPFNPQCAFCQSKMSSMKSYNSHLYKQHGKKVKEEIHTFEKKENIEDRSALKSVLFECLDCKTHFLSAQEARSHSRHSKLLNNWECEVCHRKFKTKDKLQHNNQHASYNTFIEYSLPKSALILVLYKCFKCTVHYSEDTFLAHNGSCDSKTPNSMYCHFCDILVNRDDMELHKSQHEEGKMLISDITIIETDMLDIQSVRLSKENNNINTNEIPQKKANLIMKSCNTCKCILNNTDLKTVHLQAKCFNIRKRICTSCGLVFTVKSFINHALQHKQKPIKLHDYLFYDLKSKKQILPPIPDYLKCKKCGVHFLKKSSIRVHTCQTQEYETCKICSIKLTEHAYKLHISFHNYSIQNVTVEPKQENIEPIDGETPHLTTDLGNAALRTNNFLYTCKSCQISVKTYDDVIKHCQDHYDCNEIQLMVQICQQCGLVYIDKDKCCPTCENANCTTIDFDPCYMRFNNTFWTRNIFAYISDEQIAEILKNSMYRDECRLKLEQVQPGSSNSILYQCDKCQVIIEPHCLYTHAENSKTTSCANLGKYPCAHCGLCFNSWKYRATHVKQHEEKSINPKLCRIILFNKREHDTFNQTMFDACNKYILYQCRNCDRVVDKFQRNGHVCDYSNLKMCMNCGLLFHKLDYDLHFIRHEELDKFNSDYMCVVMFGKSKGFGKRLFRSTFNKVRLDFTLYRCKNCDLCEKPKKNCMSQHICVFDESKCKCSKCGLYFLQKDLLSHCKLHDTYFDEFNMNIITYNSTTIVDAPEVEMSTKETMQLDRNLIQESVINDVRDKNDFKDQNDCKTKNDFKFQKSNCKDGGSVVKENVNNCKIYKCGCGLNFLEYENARNHVNMCNVRMKISKQSCFKCNLLFTPGELFNHLLVHHCDKKLQFKFDIVEVHKTKEMTDIS